MRHIYWCIVLMLLTVGGAAGNPDAYTVDEIFQHFKAAYDKSENFSASFEETTLFSHRRNVARGRLVFGKPNLFRKEYVDSEGCLEGGPVDYLGWGIRLDLHAAAQPK